MLLKEVSLRLHLFDQMLNIFAEIWKLFFFTQKNSIYLKYNFYFILNIIILYQYIIQYTSLLSLLINLMCPDTLFTCLCCFKHTTWTSKIKKCKIWWV